MTWPPSCPPPAAGGTRRVYRDRAKRLVDLFLAALLLGACAPLMLVVSGLIRRHLGPGVFFRQQRPGLHGRPFRLIKFRSMTDARDAAGRPLPDEERLTPFGRRLRSTSLDELPELVNVLRGEMSLVGPRPLLMRYLTRYSPEQARRHAVRPGITGLAQVSGRNALSWEDKFRLDVWYVDHCSPALDLRILLRTAGTILRREGVHQAGHATAEEFFPHPQPAGGTPEDADPPEE